MDLRTPLRASVAALTFSTIVPVGRRVDLDADDVARGSVLFPLVGAALGAASGSIAWLLGQHASPLVAAAVAVTVAAVLTGALHIDGLADYCDGYGGRTVPDRLRIMRDHGVGTYGTLAIALDLVLRVSALASVAGTSNALLISVAAGAGSRIGGVVLSAWLPYSQPRAGSGSALAGRTSRARTTATVLLAAALVIATVGEHAWIALLSCGLPILFVGWSARRRLGGVTGDVMGASVEIAEIATLIGLVCAI